MQKRNSEYSQHMKNNIRKIVNLTRATVLKANYVFNNYDEVVWLIGDGRSGTTWVSDLINYGKKYREMFEPFHPEFIRDMNFIAPHQYIRKNDSNEKLIALASDIFHGKFTHPRVDSANRKLLYEGLLIKDIFANLLCYWAVSKFPKIKPILLIRNPFAVAISKYKMKNGFWATEPLDLLSQPTLLEDYLLPFEEMIKRVSYENNYILNQVLIWSIINYVPLRQFDPGSIQICFYEDIYQEPSQAISKITQFVGGKQENSAISLPKDVIERPSRVIGTKSSLLSGTSPVSTWMNELKPKLIDDGLKILQNFGFDDLYDDMSMPKVEVLNEIHKSA